MNTVQTEPLAALSKENRMAWWRAARFGMFVHWGLYAVPAGLFKGEKPKGDFNYQAEWLQSAAKVPASTYADYAREFNPQKFDAEAWVQLAKNAGMKYLIVTAKHHEGFAMFKSAASSFNIVDATPYKRDPLVRLAAACRKHGLKLGFYYSQNFDWHHPGAGGAEWDPAHIGDADSYVDNIVIPHLRELLTNYGEIAVLWWDIPGGVINRERGERIMKVVNELAPNIITNNRLGGGFEGDTETPEQMIPANGFPGRDWEVCMTMNNTWGYSSTDKDYKSVPDFLRNLVDIVSKGGNYLLNVGPDAQGVIPQPQVERLKAIGAWLNVNGDAIYGAEASPLSTVPSWGRITRKSNRLFLHVFEWPENGQLVLPISNVVKRARLLTTRKAKLGVTRGPNGVVIALRATAPDAVASVIELEIDGEVKAVQANKLHTLHQAPLQNRIIMPARDAVISGTTARLENESRNIGTWSDVNDHVQWTAPAQKAGRYRLQMVYSSDPGEAGSTLEVSVGDKKFTVTPPATQNWLNYQTIDIGEILIDKPSPIPIIVRVANKPKSFVINIESIILEPAVPMDVRVLGVKADGLEVRLTMGNGLLQLRPMLDGAIRVRFSDGKTPEVPSLSLVEKSRTPKFKLVRGKDAVVVRTSKMSASVNRNTGDITFLDAKGQILLEEAPGSRRFKKATIQGEPTFAVEQGFVSPPGEYIFGSGQFQDDQLNIRDLPRRLIQVNMQISIPFLLSNRGYGLLWHNNGLTDLNPTNRWIPLSVGGAGATTQVTITTTEGIKEETRRNDEFHGEFTVDKAGTYAFMIDGGGNVARRFKVEIDGEVVKGFESSCHQQLSAGKHSIKMSGAGNDPPKLSFRPAANETVLRSPVAEAVDYVVFAGDADEVISSYRQVTGPAPLMPIWNYGFIQCRERYSSQQQIVDTTAEFRKRGLPLDLIVQDWQYWGKYGWNAMQWDEKDYPNPTKMMQDIHAQNARVMVSVWSKIDPNSEVGKQLATRNYYIPGTQWVDFFNPDAAAMYWKNFSARMLSLGIDAWWLDATEPENDDLVGRKVFGGPGEKVRLAYPLMVNKTVYEGQRRDAPGQRVSLLTRSAFLGQQRYASATWSGDIGNDWDTFRRQIPAGLNFVATGQPYWTTDTGGFWRQGQSQYTDPDYHERFLRWFQFSTFCPLQRVHGAGSNTEFWNYGPMVESEAKKYLDFRYRLLPYTYSQAAEVTFNGSTLMRPLVMDYADDTQALDQKYEFSYGPSILVAPVVEPGAKEWNVYLPKTPGGWFDFWTGRRLEGGQIVKSAAPISQIPLHVRAGSILPLGPSKQFTGEKPADPIELRVYRGADSTFNLYEDEGVNYNYEKGVRSTIRLDWNERTHTLSIGAREGSFPGMLQNRVFRVVAVGENKGNGVAPEERVDAEIKYNGQPVNVKLP
jgi:alpha-D-xyloside xylohydrolase